MLDRWAYENGVTLDFSRPGKPTDNAFVESFNGRLRDECLNTHWFLSLEDARVKIDAWRRDYNESRPHTSLGWLTPIECCRRGHQSGRMNAGYSPSTGMRNRGTLNRCRGSNCNRMKVGGHVSRTLPTKLHIIA